MQKSPDAFRTISEVAELLETPAHVLRFWESRFPQIRPVKRAGGRRYYRPADVALLTGIRRLLHDEGMTIRGVQKILREQGVQHVSGVVDDNGTAEDDAAIEAAVTAPGGGGDGAEGLPVTTAESAEVIALQPVPRQVPDDARAADARADARTDARRAPGDDARRDAPPFSPAAAEVADLFSRLPAADLQEMASALPDTSEAPMAVWADEIASDAALFPPDPDAPDEAALAPVSPMIAATTAPPSPIAPPVPAPAPPDLLQTGPILMAPTLAQRLRATRAGSLSPEARATLAALRDVAQALRDRVARAPRGPL
ncbi:MAG: MerR family transcriptional regulator [Rhodobacteraceae bacterium]|nr:MerR family transcriptional regulator [Paracoccaceae bacterium]